MKWTGKQFRGLKAAEVMSRTAAVLPQGMSMAAAARLLLEQPWHAAPVIDAHGALVGVLAPADVVRWAVGDRRDSRGPARPGCVWSDWQVVDRHAAGRDEVRRHLTCDPRLVGPDTRLADVAEAVLDPAGRPVVVVDAGRRPLGVIAARDVLAALAATDHRFDDKPLAARFAETRVPRRRPAHSSGRS